MQKLSVPLGEMVRKELYDYLVISRAVSGLHADCDAEGC